MCLRGCLFMGVITASGMACRSSLLIMQVHCPALQVSELKAHCSKLGTLREEQQQLNTQQMECERLAAFNSELRLRTLDLPVLQQERSRLVPLADEALQLKQQVQELEEETAELPAVKVGWCGQT